jgi:methylated-DNA-protein-cysteine methyltransferase-like protein
MTDIFTTRARDIIRQIPPGKVTTYGIIAGFAGNSSGARQVARILYARSEKYELLWHREVNRNGQISPRPSMGYLWQRQLLEEDGVVFGENGRIVFSIFLRRPG